MSEFIKPGSYTWKCLKLPEKVETTIKFLFIAHANITAHLRFTERSTDCGCIIEGTKNESSICDPVTGQCDCKCAIGGKTCDVCTDMHYNWPECEEHRKITDHYKNSCLTSTPIMYIFRDVDVNKV